MARSEFRWNKKRKHYAYLFKDVGVYCKNFLLHGNPQKKKDWNSEKQKEFEKKHTKLHRHPNRHKLPSEIYYVENRIYVDKKQSFGSQTYKWKWDPNDKRRIKRLKKGHRTR